MVFAGFDFLFAGVQIALAHRRFGLRPLQRLRVVTSLPQLFGVSGPASRFETGGRGLQADARLLERRAGAGDPGLIPADCRRRGDGIDLQQELAGLDTIALANASRVIRPIVWALMFTVFFGSILPDAETMASRSRR